MPVARAAFRLGISPAWLKAEVLAKRLPAIDCGGTILVNLTIVQQALARRGNSRDALLISLANRGWRIQKSMEQGSGAGVQVQGPPGFQDCGKGLLAEAACKGARGDSRRSWTTRNRSGGASVSLEAADTYEP
jgi:hypothetical protein